jgi:cyclopropane-fatty-acyl-phospholipid synthase
MNTAITAREPTRRLRLFENVLRMPLERIRHGLLRLEVDGEVREYGRFAPDGLQASVSVHNRRFFRRAALGGSIGVAESFIDGDWTTDNLTALARLFVRNRAVLETLEGGLARLGLTGAQLLYASRRNTRRGSRRNIAEHYDLGNDFFQRMLDPTMTYSSAIFRDPQMSLEQASRHKLDLLCRKLDLGPGDHLLEIGTGWGSMALHAARTYGCRVTTTTISREQRDLAQARVAAAGLSDRVTALERDYRDLTGRYDKIVTVEMIEAVGWRYYEEFFARCADRLRPGGRLAMQAITIADDQFARAKDEADFIKRYIFPGSCIPSVTALLQSASRRSDLRPRSLEDYTPHYARTLAAWRENLAPHQGWVTSRYGERFWRMWQYYLGYCEGGFAEGHIGLVQMTFERDRWAQ